ncbi:hypothetical protein [Halosolutus halophilus]|uniref:hypothetical protein n=1 Tax=Halosolutus halophilus TaxID=1552990 RepID=UPI0022352770|nr:hypothetical protein [Halosolutus halophilus]
MPTIRYTDDGGRYRAGGVTFEPGDEGEVSAGLAEHLVDAVGDFEYVTLENADADKTTNGDDASEDSLAGEDESPEDDDLIDELQGLTIPEFEAELESGRFDDRLDAVAEAEREGKDRAGVHDAIGVRRAEIEG